jgi:hypothetical protein
VAVAGLAAATIIGNSDGAGSPQAEEIAVLALLTSLGGAAGGLVGWIAGGGSHTKTVLVEGRPAESLGRVLARLRRSARVPSLR